jgi:hypothetical protein
MTKLPAEALLKLHPVDSFPLIPTDCQAPADVTTAVSPEPHKLTSEPVLLYISYVTAASEVLSVLATSWTVSSLENPLKVAGSWYVT